MESINKYLFLLLGLAVMNAVVSCRKDEDVSAEKRIRYEVSGDVTIPVTIRYTPTVESIQKDEIIDPHVEISALPWIKEVKLSNQVQDASCSIHVIGGEKGQKIMIKIYQDDKLKDSDEGVVGESGYLSLILYYLLGGL